MADGQTTNFKWTLSENHINTNQWGGQNNANWQDADTKVYANQQAIAAIRGQTSTPTVSNVQVARTASVPATVTFANSTAPAGQQVRWLWGANAAAADAVGNTGSDMFLNAYGNAGEFLRTVIFIARSNGSMSFTGTASFSSILTCKSNISVTAASTSDDAYVGFFNSAGTRQGYVGWTAGLDQVLLVADGGGALILDAAANFVFNGSGNAFKAGGGLWVATSDARIKTVTGDYEAGLDEVLQLRPVFYRYRGNDAAPGERSLANSKQFVGLVAQELEHVMPNMVSQRKGFIDGREVDDLRDVDVSSLVFALVNCVKQLKAEIEALKAK